MENYYLVRIDWAEWFPGSTVKVIQAIELGTDELLAEIKISTDEFWDLPGDEFEESDLEEWMLEALLEEYSENQGD